MRIELILAGLVFLTFRVAGDNSTFYTCAERMPVVEYNFTDQMRAGHTIYQFSDGIQSKSSCSLMTVKNNTVLLTKDLSTVCSTTIQCTFTCTSAVNLNLAIVGHIHRYETYTTMFYEETYYTRVRERDPVSTRISIDPPVKVRIVECGENASSVHTDYGLIKDGNGTFKWKTQTSNNALVVTRDIDYERTKYYNLEILYQNFELKANATAKIHVTVLDLDDEDPIFNTSEYFLRPMEEDSSVVNSWIETSPRIFAYDQDVGINAPVVYSIRHQADPGLFRINTTTGLMAISRILDREETASYTIVIQAAQTDNAMRTATATIMVHVVDVDDNPPTFHQSYTVNVTQHAIVGTIVTIVKAVDIDEGINANFTYTLYDDTLPFIVDPLTGIVRVTHSERLDKDRFKGGVVSFQVGTKPANADGVTGNTATVTAHIIDTNDSHRILTDVRQTFGGNEIGLIVLSCIVLIGAITAGIVFRKLSRRATRIQNKGASLRQENRPREAFPIETNSAMNSSSHNSGDGIEMTATKQHTETEHNSTIAKGLQSDQRARNTQELSNDERIKNVKGLPKDERSRVGLERSKVEDTKHIQKWKINERTKHVQSVSEDYTLPDDATDMETEAGYEYISGEGDDKVCNTHSKFDEPAIDYTVKSVRISNEVLDLERNKIVQLNASQDAADRELHNGLGENGVEVGQTLPDVETSDNRMMFKHKEYNAETSKRRMFDRPTITRDELPEKQTKIRSKQSNYEVSESRMIASHVESGIETPERVMMTKHSIPDVDISEGATIDRYTTPESDMELEQVKSDTSYDMVKYLPSEEELSLPMSYIDETYSESDEDESHLQYQIRGFQVSKISDV